MHDNVVCVIGCSVDEFLSSCDVPLPLAERVRAFYNYRYAQKVQRLDMLLSMLCSQTSEHRLLGHT